MGLVTLTALAYYLWWPKHTFPVSVAKILRKGLWAESDKGEKDFQLALKHYLQALDECNSLEIDPLCDEYTGIQLKIGEMYERLNMLEEAAFVYNEIATLYLSVLRAAPKSEQAKRIRNLDHRGHLIQRDLRIALKLTELNRSNPSLCKAILITHLQIAQDEIDKKLGLLTGEKITPSDLKEKTLPAELLTEGNADLLKALEKSAQEQDGSKLEELVIPTFVQNPEAYQPFADEFFNAMDLLSAICLAVGDVDMATKVRVKMNNKMMCAGMDPYKLLLSQCNMASLLYFQAEQVQAQEMALRKQFSETAGVDYEKVKAIHDPLQPTTVEKDEADEIRQQLSKSVLDKDKQSYQQLVSLEKQLIPLVIEAYQAVIDASKNLPQEVRDSTAIGETVALATYGLGVVNLHLSSYDKAERLLREARVRSRNCGYDALIDEIERELTKLMNERRQAKTKDEGIEMEIHMKK